MKKLSDLIIDRSEDLDIQFSRATVKAPEAAEWIKCKQAVNAYPVQWEMWYADIVRKDPKKAKKHSSSGKIEGKMTNIDQIKCRLGKVGDFETELVFNEDQDGNILKAYYVAFNNFTQSAYLRWLVGN